MSRRLTETAPIKKQTPTPTNRKPAMEITLVIKGRPVPKKNNAVMVANRNLILPSKAFRNYEKDALKQLQGWGNQYIDGPVEVTAIYWLPDARWRPDMVGLMQGTADLLEKAGLIPNDQNILSWDGTRIMPEYDKGNPRAEIRIREMVSA